MTAAFGLDHVVVELVDHGRPLDSEINDVLAELARDHGLPVVATNNVHYATPDRTRLASAMAAVRARRSLAEMDGWLDVPGAHLRSGAEMVGQVRTLSRGCRPVGRPGQGVRVQPQAGQAATAQDEHPGRAHADQLAARAVPDRSRRTVSR